MSAAELAHVLGGALPALPIDRELSDWQGRIASAAATGGGLDVYRAALVWVGQNVPAANGLREKAKQEIQETAERHLDPVHSTTVLEAIYFDTFPEDEEHNNAGINNRLDAEITNIDNRNATAAEIKRLARLPLIEYERQRKASAEKLEITRIAALDNAVKAARAGNGDTNGQGRPLELPAIEPWLECVNGADLLDGIRNAVKRYLVLPESSAECLALWVVHTHAFQCFEHTPRLAITAPEKQCGKSKTLDVLECLVASPLRTSNIKSATIFRTIEKATPTLLIDEADTFLNGDDEARGILNDGHKRGGQTIRLVGEKYEPRQFSTFCPVAIAMIGRLPDTLEDRSVSINLRRARTSELMKPFRSDRADDLRQLARKAARWVADNRKDLAAADPATGTLINRPADNWRPLMAIADIAGRGWAKVTRSIAESAQTAKQDQSRRTMVLIDICEFFAAHPGTDRVRSTELANALGEMENRPWSEWRNGKPITPAALARTPWTFWDCTRHQARRRPDLQGLSPLRLRGGIRDLHPKPNRHTVTNQSRRAL